MGPGHVISLALFLGLLQLTCGGDINIGFSPPSLKFGLASTLSLSDLDNVLAASLGYTTSNALWKGLTVTSPFNLPKALVLVEIENGNAFIDRDGPMYPTRPDVPVEIVMEILSTKLKSQAQRTLNFQDLNISNGATKASSFPSQHLDATKSIDKNFLSQMQNILSAVDEIKAKSVISHGGQDVVFMKIESFYPLVDTYGGNSTQVKEAIEILRTSLSRLVQELRKFYSDSLLFASVVTDRHDSPLLRSKRAFTDKEDTSNDLNLVDAYGDDYPVVFNIILFFSIIMVITIIAVSASMAFMDPGRDSIIYRMTNPRMKKD